MMNREEDKNAELTRRINADLKIKLQSKSQDDPDFVEDSAYVEDLFKKIKL